MSTVCLFPSVGILAYDYTEVRAALHAGMQSIVVDRPGNAPLADTDIQEFTIVHSLGDLALS